MFGVKGLGKSLGWGAALGAGAAVGYNALGGDKLTDGMGKWAAIGAGILGARNLGRAGGAGFKTLSSAINGQYSKISGSSFLSKYRSSIDEFSSGWQKSWMDNVHASTKKSIAGLMKNRSKLSSQEYRNSLVSLQRGNRIHRYGSTFVTAMPFGAGMGAIAGAAYGAADGLWDGNSSIISGAIKGALLGGIASGAHKLNSKYNFSKILKAKNFSAKKGAAQANAQQIAGINTKTNSSINIGAKQAGSEKVNVFNYKPKKRTVFDYSPPGAKPAVKPRGYDEAMEFKDRMNNAGFKTTLTMPPRGA